jgi:hypothetical protein
LTIRRRLREGLIFAGTLTGLRGGGAGTVNDGGNLLNSIGHGFVPPPCGLVAITPRINYRERF